MATRLRSASWWPRWLENRGLLASRAGDRRDPRQAKVPRLKLRYSCRRGHSATGAGSAARGCPAQSCEFLLEDLGGPQTVAAKATHASRSSPNHRRSYGLIRSAMASLHGEFCIPTPLVMQPSADSSCRRVRRVPNTPEAILIIRDPFGVKLRFRSQPFKRGNSLLLAFREIPANRATKNKMRPTEAA